jgi:lipid-binding SYLF domain-containing protein
MTLGLNRRNFIHRTVAGTALIAGGSLLATACSSTSDQPGTEQRELVTKAQTTLSNFAADPDLSWFRNNVPSARGVLIVPTVVRAGFIFGGSGGSGVLLARDSAQGWSYPAFYTLGSVSFGLLAGADVAEVILMVRSDKGMDAMLSNSFKLGTDVSVAVGPVGAGAQVATSDILAFSRAKGVYGGLSLDGSVITVRDSWNAAYYGREVRPVDILVSRVVVNPQADPLRATLTRVASIR